MQRRDFLQRHVAGALGMVALGGCGFAPRKAPDMPFKTLAFSGFALQSPMKRELELLINTSRDTRVIDDLAQAEVIFDVITDAQERNRSAITTAGQIRSLTLSYRFKFRLRTLSGKELLPPSELLAGRSMAYNESQALAKETEEASLFHGMMVDVADQVMRRLATVRMT